MADKKTRVTFAYPYTDKAGKSYKAGDSAELSAAEALAVVGNGVGRADDSKTDAGKVAK